ncbi:hypothetical protein [Dactylosporangium sp. NPDC051541]|uniref:hypothetical protein n=1 Tax=Dactylosporangium sp. NPDC051541 TaxID=3363977 RepID=UPI003796D8B5
MTDLLAQIRATPWLDDLRAYLARCDDEIRQYDTPERPNYRPISEHGPYESMLRT